MSWENLSIQLSEAVTWAARQQRRLAEAEELRLSEQRARLAELTLDGAGTGLAQRRRTEAVAEAAERRRTGEATRSRLAAALAQLEERAASASEELVAYCVQRTQRLRSDADTGRDAWVPRLREWHQSARRVWEPRSDLDAQLAARGIVDAAEALWAELIDSAPLPSDADEPVVPDGEIVARCQVHQNAADRAIEQLRKFAVESGSMQIVRDLPDPNAGLDLAELREIHNVLAFLDVLLGRYAESATFEVHALEALD